MPQAPPSPQRRIVHRRQIVEDERGGVYQFDRAGRRDSAVGVADSLIDLLLLPLREADTMFDRVGPEAMYVRAQFFIREHLRLGALPHPPGGDRVDVEVSLPGACRPGWCRPARLDGSRCHRLAWEESR